MKESISGSPRTPGAAVPSDLETICVGGITPFTTIDFPGRLAGVFYLQGCPWRCRYCYNTEFWPFPPEGNLVPNAKVLRFLESRRKHFEGIVFSGGEPTAHEKLVNWMRAVKAMGYEIGLHTNGMFPVRLREVLAVCDWVGMDVKAPFDRYEKITRVPGSGEAARESAEILLAEKTPCEFRTTVHPGLLSEDDLLAIAQELAARGAQSYVLQTFRREHCQDKELRESDFHTAGISANLRVNLQTLFPHFQIRE